MLDIPLTVVKQKNDVDKQRPGSVFLPNTLYPSGCLRQWALHLAKNNDSYSERAREDRYSLTLSSCIHAAVAIDTISG